MRIISGFHKGRKLFLPDPATTRPTADLVKSSLFNILQDRVIDAVVLDLFAGSGSLGLEALSRGAKKAYFVEKDSACYQVLKKNCAIITGEKYTYNMDYASALTEFSVNGTKFDLIFLDPPYASEFSENALKLLCEKNLCNNDCIIVVEKDFRDELNVDLPNLLLYDTRKYARKKLYFFKYKN